MKSCSPQALSCIIKTVILLGNFFHLVCVMLLICQQRFLFNDILRFFIFFIKNAFFNVFYSWGQRFLHLWYRPPLDGPFRRAKNGPYKMRRPGDNSENMKVNTMLLVCSLLEQLRIRLGC